MTSSPMKPLRVLVVEDSENDYLLLLRKLRAGGFEVVSRCVGTSDELGQALAGDRWDIILSDYTMPQFTALDALALLQRSSQPDVPFVIVSGSIGEESAVAALKAGASDYLMKSNLDKLVPVVERELRDALVRRERGEAFVALEQAVRVRDEFLSIASHELKTPLTAVQLQLESLRDIAKRGAIAGDEKLVSRLERAVKSGRRLGQLVDTLLDVSKISTGRLTLDLEPFDLAITIREVAERLREEARANRSELQVVGDDSLIGSWDRLRIEQVLTNLLSNAVKYGVGKPIELELTHSPITATIRVIDHGMGVSQEDLERIFGRFERAVPSRHYGGLGLGLFISRQIVAAHGGTVKATQTPGGGATFALELPRSPTAQVTSSGAVPSDLEPATTAPALREPALAPNVPELSVLIDSVRDYAVFMLDPRGRIVTWNAGAERIKQYTAAEVVGKHVSLFYTIEDVRQGKPARLMETAARVGRVEDEGWRVRKDGTRFWANVVVSAINDGRGRLVGFVKVTRDVTDRKRAEDELGDRARQQEAVALLGVYALKTRDLSAVLDRAVQLVTTTLGTKLGSILELDRDSNALVMLSGSGWKQGLLGSKIPLSSAPLAGFTLQSGAPIVVDDLRTEQPFSVPTILSDHGVISGMSVVIPSPEEATPYGVFATFTTERRSFSANDTNFLKAVANVVATAIARRRDEEQLRRAEQTATDERRQTALAREAVRERDDFVAVAAHELRTPLTALQLKLQGMEHMVTRQVADQTASQIADRLDAALRHTNRLTNLVERLLDVSRIVGGSVEVCPEEVDLEVIGREVILDFREQARAANVEIRLAVSGDMHGAWDKRGIEQVLTNLLANALKYGRDKPVDLMMEGDTAGVHILVKDCGIGVAEHDAQRIFGRFERAAPVRHYGGLGLGLYIARRIVEAHGGSIRVSSERGRGATFRVDLPRRPAAIAAPPRANELSDPS